MKKKRMFDGFGTVFSFTSEQTVKGKGFKASTIGLFILLFVIMAALNVIIMFATRDDNDSDDDFNDVIEKTQCDLQNLYIYGKLEFNNILNSDGERLVITGTDFNVQQAVLDSTVNSSAVNVTDKTASLKNYNSYLNEDEVKSARKIISSEINEKDKTAALFFYINENNNVKIEFLCNSCDNNGENDILEKICENVKDTIITKSGITKDMVQAANMGLQVATFEAAEDENLGIMLTKILLPMLLTLIIYMLVLTNGQSISKAILSEKTSKLLETLLTSVQPYAVITGKVLAMALIALAQMFLWLIGGIAGFAAGNAISKSIDPDFANPLIGLMDAIKEGAKDAFSIQAVIMAIIFIVVGFLMYCCIAAFSAALADKAEDLSSTASLFQIPVIFSFLLAYFATMIDNKAVFFIVRYVPLISPFSIPADILMGNVSIFQGIISLIILMITTVSIIFITGKTYKNRVFGKN